MLPLLYSHTHAGFQSNKHCRRVGWVAGAGGSSVVRRPLMLDGSPDRPHRVDSLICPPPPPSHWGNRDRGTSRLFSLWGGAYKRQFAANRKEQPMKWQQTVSALIKMYLTMHVWMNVCICMYLMNVYVCMYVYVCVYVCVCMCVCMCMYVCVYVCACMCMYVQVCSVYVWLHLCIVCMSGLTIHT